MTKIFFGGIIMLKFDETNLVKEKLDDTKNQQIFGMLILLIYLSQN